MSRHRRSSSRAIPALLVVGTAALVATAGVLVFREPAGEQPQAAAAADPCVTTLRVVAASSYAPVLRQVEPTLGSGADCIDLVVITADGRTAARRVPQVSADVWIPDDAAWAGVADMTGFAEESVAGSGTLLATSPIYMVTDSATSEVIKGAGGGWRNLVELATQDAPVRLVVRDPGSSGDGLLAAGALGEAVWLDQGMDAAAMALTTALPSTRTVTELPMPAAAGEVGLVPEYALVTLLGEAEGGAAATARESTIIAASDYTAMLRFTWLPTAAAATDPALVEPLARLLGALTSDAARDALAAVGLRNAAGEPLAGGASTLPEIPAAPFDVLGAHNVDHVLATWYPEDRRSDVLVVVDVSGSMGAAAGGSATPIINLVRDGIRQLADLLPDDSELALWDFGSLLDPPRDYRVLVPRGPLDASQRQGLDDALDALVPLETGTGLYDTLLAAHAEAQVGGREGIPNHVVLFTDGRNEDDPGSISAQQLTDQLVAALDPERPVHVTVIMFGPQADANVIVSALEPVDAYVDPISTAAEVLAVFIHVAAGGVHH